MGLRRRRLGKVWLLIGLLPALWPGSGCRQRAWPLWESYQARFIDGQGRVIDHTGGDRTTSEGQAYALFFALVTRSRWL